ncbi:hypothetical protein SAMN05216266_101514 [Amycolatopsis marina]|uniref:Uncharacterized protein n=1 Tax=Amycolatopsis marina TaxID=490629 RepID=A0A1I0VUP2_9PSEU|nr:hypothetical protein SAMN05216266_101514 [Amycolatopsis marina]
MAAWAPRRAGADRPAGDHRDHSGRARRVGGRRAAGPGACRARHRVASVGAAAPAAGPDAVGRADGAGPRDQRLRGRRRLATGGRHPPRLATAAAGVAAGAVAAADPVAVVPGASAAPDAVPGARGVARHRTATVVRRPRLPATVRACHGPVPAPASGGCGRRSRMSLPDRRGLGRRPVFMSCGVQHGQDRHCPAVLRERGCVSPVPRTYDCTRWFQLHDRHTSTT